MAKQLDWSEMTNKTPVSMRKYDKTVAYYVAKQLLEDEVSFSVTFSSNVPTEATLIIPKSEEEAKIHWTRGENAAHYWLVEAPGRYAPDNSTDDYKPEDYPPG